MAVGATGLGPLGAAIVDNPAITGMVMHHPMLYADLQDPLALLRSGRNETALAAYWTYASTRSPESPEPTEATGDADVADYTALMAASQPLVSGEVLDAYRVAATSG